ncbi:Trm112p-domain-containing protein [Trichodelitschia bisporula]|uniref:Trm112p-domain-containing protein n=1 Tax=Trichodelitschia bisporula TaxID=703511 RepID=A0A6G1IBA9_9PEZI|nr:Trm112p-domain-containing protein [Trichodelitschia bisporula]
MKLLTLNFLTCARKACKPLPTSFPLHPADATLATTETAFSPAFLRNILPRLDWPALKGLCDELGLPGVGDEAPGPEALFEDGELPESDEDIVGEIEAGKRPTKLAHDLHQLLVETVMLEGKLVCASCGHEYAVKEGIANFLLPSHLV